MEELKPTGKVINLNDIIDNDKKTFGQKAADFIAAQIGSWRFLIIQSILIIIWVVINIIAWINHFDPYPFILLNLFLSLQAGFTGPILMLSQNRQEQKDRIKADHNYKINEQTNNETEMIFKHLEYQNVVLENILNLLKEKGNEHL